FLPKTFQNLWREISLFDLVLFPLHNGKRSCSGCGAGEIMTQVVDAAGSFAWNDPFDLNGQLAEDDKLVRDSARTFAQRHLAPRAVRDYLEERFDREVAVEMGRAGFFGATLSRRYGGAGLSHVAYGLAAREIERIDSGYRSLMSVQSSLVMQAIFAFGSDAQREKYLPKLAKGEFIG